MPVNVGEAADVPPINFGAPSNQIRKRSPWAATSGTAWKLISHITDAANQLTYTPRPNWGKSALNCGSIIEDLRVIKSLIETLR